MKLRISRKAFVEYLRSNLDTIFFQYLCGACALSRATGQYIQPPSGRKGVKIDEMPVWAIRISRLDQRFTGRQILTEMGETV